MCELASELVTETIREKIDLNVFYIAIVVGHIILRQIAVECVVEVPRCLIFIKLLQCSNVSVPDTALVACGPLWKIRAMFLQDVLCKLVLVKITTFDMFRWWRSIGVHQWINGKGVKPM